MERDKVKSILFEKIREAKSPYFEDVLEKISEKDTLNDLPFDNLDVIELTMQLEDEFNIKISDEFAQDFEKKTIGDIINYIYEQVKNDDSDHFYM